MLCSFVSGKRYNVADVSAALCMSLGLIWFTLADSKVAPNFNVTGNISLIQHQNGVVLQNRSNTTLALQSNKYLHHHASWLGVALQQSWDV